MILGVDTSLGTAVGIVGEDGAVLAEAVSADPRGHAEVIGDLLAAAIDQAGIVPADIRLVATGMGPGPFTGLRVGIAAARAFAAGHGVPVAAVPSHDAVALDVLRRDPHAAPFAIVTDARRREFAYSRFEGLDGAGVPQRIDGPHLVPRDDVDAALAGARRLDVDLVSGAAIALLALRAGDRVLAGPEPLYLRAPDATLGAGPKKVTA